MQSVLQEENTHSFQRLLWTWASISAYESIFFFVSYLIKTSNKKPWEIRSLQAEQLLILLAKGHKQGEVPADARTSTLTWVQNTDKKKAWQDEIPKEYLILLLFVSVQSKVRKPLMSAELDVLLTRELVTWQEITKGWL